jgi:hypothetical protein
MKNKHDQSAKNEIEDNFIGYPLYDESDDIYKNKHNKLNINIERVGESNELNETKLIIDDDLSGSDLENDLDIPGAELDDEDEDIGSEDEENNFYSGSDND